MSGKLKYINGALNVPEAIGAYSQAVVSDNLVYLSGQVPLDPHTGNLVEGGIDAHTEQVMRNVLALLNHMSLDFSSVIKTNIFLINIRDFTEVNEIYSKWMGGYRPARSTVQVAGLPAGALVEMEMIANLELSGAPQVAEGTIADLKDAEIAFSEVDCKSN